MTKKNILHSGLVVLVSLAFLSGCTLVYNFDKQKTSKILNQQLDKKNAILKDSAQDYEKKELKERVAEQSQIKKFKDRQELREFLEENDLALSDSLTYKSRGGSDFGLMAEGMGRPLVTRDDLEAPSDSIGREMVQPSTGETGISPGERDYSKTNVQVEGVDEADIIKSDGTYIYAVSRNNLFIIRAYPAENAEILSKIEFKSRPSDIYIAGDKLAVFGTNDQIYQADYYQKFRRRGNFTFFKIFDIADRKNPKQIKDFDFEGAYQNSRLIGDYVYFTTITHDYYYLDDEPLLPRLLEGGREVPDACAGASGERCFAPPVYYFNIPYNSYNFTTVTAINLKDINQPLSGEVYLLSSSQNMYVSQKNIYITYTKYLSEYQLEMEVARELIYPRLAGKDQERIDKIESSENYILSPQEKREKIYQIIARYGENLSEKEQADTENELKKKMKEKYLNLAEELEKTVIHKIAIDREKLQYVGFGEVTGQALNQFSMDESNGYFRIATTKSQSWSRFSEGQQKSYCNLFVLDGEMKIVGSLKGLAEDERIYSARFMQNRAYMVTFKQTDPLFVIDLSDPRKPAVLGMLKIPGFSNYLHPYDNNTLIGIGKDTKENEWGGVQTLGLKLSLFDVSKVDQPKELDTYVLGGPGSDSIALFDHRAFLFSKEKNLLVIPVSLTESVMPGRWGGGSVFGGAAVFEINDNKFEYRGRIDHSEKGVISPVDYWDGYNYYDNTVKRSLYIEEILFTFSNNRLLANDLKDLSSVKNLGLAKEPGGDDYRVIN